MHKERWLNRGMITAPYFTLCVTEEQFRELKRKLSWDAGEWAPPNGARTHHGANETGDPVCVVCVNGWDRHDPIQVASMIVHEAVHVFQEWCREFGEKTPSSEFEAYSIQWISEQLMYEFVRQTQEKQHA